MPRKRNKPVRTLLLLVTSVITAIALLGGCFHSDDSKGGRPPASQQPDILRLDLVLSGDQETPPVTTTASGSGHLEINLETGAISGSITTNVVNATMAHIHHGYAGENGPALITLEANVDTWQVPANAMLDAEALEEVLEGELYVNVHSEAHPGGEVRAQLLPEGLEVIRVTLQGAEEVPPITTDNSAFAALTLDHDRRLLHVHLLGVGLDDATAAHVHTGFAGEEGAPVISLAQEPTTLAHWFADDAVLTTATYHRLRAAGLYLNVHTPAYPEGEVRGQIVPDTLVPLPSFQVSAQTPAANAQVNTLPNEIVLVFNTNVEAASVLVGAFEIVRAGGDGSFGEGNEIVINIAQAQVSASDASQVVLDIAGNAGPNDLYRLTVNDMLQSQEGVGLDGDADGNAGGSYQRTFSVAAQAGMQPQLSSIQAEIFTPICSVCHGASVANAGMRLNEGNAFNFLVDVDSTEVASLKRVAPGDPDNSYIIQKLEGRAAVGSRMPLGGPYLSQDQINVIRQWITNGALNN